MLHVYNSRMMSYIYTLDLHDNFIFKCRHGELSLIHGWPHRDLGPRGWGTRFGVHHLPHPLVEAHHNELEELEDTDNGEAEEEADGPAHAGQDAANSVLGEVLNYHCCSCLIINLNLQESRKNFIFSEELIILLHE